MGSLANLVRISWNVSRNIKKRDDGETADLNFSKRPIDHRNRVVVCETQFPMHRMTHQLLKLAKLGTFDGKGIPTANYHSISQAKSFMFPLVNCIELELYLQLDHPPWVLGVGWAFGAWGAQIRILVIDSDALLNVW